LKEQVHVAINAGMRAPVILIELFNQRKEHFFKLVVSLCAHEDFAFIDLDCFNVLFDWQIRAIPFKQTLFPSVEGDDNTSEAHRSQTNEVAECIVFFVLGVREHMRQFQAWHY